MKYFRINELARCFNENGARCRECRLKQPANKLPDGVEENLQALVEQVLDPVRERFGKPIKVNSGFRCPIHNRTVGGVPGSQHVKGEAADIAPAGLQLTAYGLKELARLVEVIKENGKFDQLIIYPRFVHVSWKRSGGNRKQVIDKA